MTYAIKSCYSLGHCQFNRLSCLKNVLTRISRRRFHWHFSSESVQFEPVLLQGDIVRNVSETAVDRGKMCLGTCMAKGVKVSALTLELWGCLINLVCDPTVMRQTFCVVSKTAATSVFHRLPVSPPPPLCFTAVLYSGVLYTARDRVICTFSTVARLTTFFCSDQCYQYGTVAVHCYPDWNADGRFHQRQLVNQRLQ